MASNLLSSLTGQPVHASQLRQLGPQWYTTLYPHLSPVIYSIADVLMPGRGQSAGPTPAAWQYTAPTPQPPYLSRPDRLVEPAARTPASRTPVQARETDSSGLAQILRDMNLGSGRGNGNGNERADTPRSRRVQEVNEDEDEDAEDEDEDAEDEDSGAEARQRVRQLKKRNPAAYQAARQKLRESQQTDSRTGDMARVWIASFLQLPLWEERRPSQPLSALAQRTKLRAARQKLDER